MVIMWGIAVSIVSVLAGYIYALIAGPKLPVPFDDNQAAGESYEELKAKYGTLPSAFKSFAPILIPLILIAFSSFISYPTNLAKIGGKESTLYVVATFLGNPVIALSIGVVLCFFLAPFTEEVTNGWIGSGVKDGANIIMITAAGGGLGAVIAASGVGNYIGEALSSYNFGIFLPFIIAAALKTAQGSSTVAIVTTAQIIAPMLASLGLGAPMGAVLATLAIGSGAMVVSHANDSYFWVVSQFSDMDLNTAYKAQTVATFVQGVVAVLTIYGISLYML